LKKSRLKPEQLVFHGLYLTFGRVLIDYVIFSCNNLINKQKSMWFHPYLLVLFSLLISFVIVYVSIPSIVTVALTKRLFDEPGHRKSHLHSIPNLGGIAIFAGLIITTGLFANFGESRELIHVLVAMVVIFFIGIKDDILIIAPAKKLYGEMIAAIIVVVIGNIRFTSLHGFLGIYEIDYIPSLLLTSFVVVVLTNAFNLIDGIDGLASSIGIVVSLTFGTWFLLTGFTNYAILSAALLGCLIAFFGFNVFGKKNKIFMGDTGSLILGLIMSILVIKFNEANITYQGIYTIKSAPAVSFGILIVPLFDTLRVFFLRILRGQSPFRPDKNHMHHRVLKLGFSHFESTALMAIVNIFFIIMVLTCQSAGLIFLMLLNLTLACFFAILTEYFIRKHKIREHIHS
jgi:UDP-GlcNAc:undecaprenyl-phosphate/decaprenyl-phosphate GlcNAc-1-phosphate transferase